MTTRAPFTDAEIVEWVATGELPRRAPLRRTVLPREPRLPVARPEPVETFDVPGIVAVVGRSVREESQIGIINQGHGETARLLDNNGAPVSLDDLCARSILWHKSSRYN